MAAEADRSKPKAGGRTWKGQGYAGCSWFRYSCWEGSCIGWWMVDEEEDKEKDKEPRCGVCGHGNG
jgi:hypothetical protein